jgi:hypothetical protein
MAKILRNRIAFMEQQRREYLCIIKTLINLLKDNQIKVPAFFDFGEGDKVNTGAFITGTEQEIWDMIHFEREKCLNLHP